MEFAGPFRFLFSRSRQAAWTPLVGDIEPFVQTFPRLFAMSEADDMSDIRQKILLVPILWCLKLSDSKDTCYSLHHAQLIRPKILESLPTSRTSRHVLSEWPTQSQKPKTLSESIPKALVLSSAGQLPFGSVTVFLPEWCD